ncbi:hypothetical protein L6164_007770 [Bauhinia variegata]|uniref:Uncharacterized protein n=1 Tax=Bauhinia variegata TaxID=167791 RepID=A0ACB9PFT2_BAUVA|nr:hypothetical protein L6164_007770 [Bauhinia variegata]
MLSLVILIFFSSLHHTTSLPPNATLSGCLNTFSCGTLRNISYPFTGGERPSYCGPPQFHLSCRSDSPELKISSLSYRVLQLDQDEKVLTLARSDLWGETCTREFLNSSFDLNIFNYSRGTEVLNLMYACIATTAIWPTPSNLFYCEFNGTRYDSYSLIGPVPRDPILDLVKCHASVQVPIFESEANRLKGNRSLLSEVLMKGFNMSYTNPYDDDCAECLGSGGLCGFDSDFGIPICICGDKLCPESGSNSKGKVIGVAVGVAAFVGILLVGLLFLVFRRRKRIAEESKNKELFVPHSSGGGGTSTTSMSRSVPSYASSNVESLHKSFYFGVQVFDYAELEEATDNFNSSMELGDGGFGVVYYGKLKDGRAVAVKRLYESNFKRVEQFKNEIEILAKLRHTNLNHELVELVDPYLGFERDPAIRRMITTVAELAFRCLQQDRDLRPSMNEVLNVLRGIQKDEYGQQDSEVVDIRADEVIPLKKFPPPLSPDSVADKWVSSSTTSNSS